MLANGVLAIDGTTGNDRIVVSVVGRNSMGAFVQVKGLGRYPLGQIQSISVNGSGGNDYIDINVRKADLKTTIVDGDGNQVILGTPGADTISVGAGNSVILGRGGRDQIHTGSGRSLVNGKWLTSPALKPQGPANTPPASTTTVANNPSTTTSGTSSTSTSGGYTVLPDPVLTVDVSAWAASIANLTNQQRAAAGLSPLTINSKLTAIAQIAVNQMFQTGVVTHDMTGTQYPLMQDRAAAVGYSYQWLGENLLFNLPDPASVVTAFMNSPSHRENMLFSSFTEFGIAAVSNIYGQVYVSIEFGQPS